MNDLIIEAHRRLLAFSFSSKRYSIEATRRWILTAKKKRKCTASEREALQAALSALEDTSDPAQAVVRARNVLSKAKRRIKP